MTVDNAIPATHRPEVAQEAPEAIREIQAAREAKWAEAIWGVRRNGTYLPTDIIAAVMALAAEETYTATSGLRQELAQAQAEVERWKSAWQQGDRAWAADRAREVSLRASMHALADDFARGDLGYPQGEGYAAQWGFDTAGMRLRAALAAEPTPAAEPHAEDGARRQIDPQSAADALEAAIHMVDDDDAAEVLAKMADQWRAEAKSAAQGNEGRPSATWPFKHNHFTRDVKPKGECPACDYRPAPVADPDDTKNGQR